MSDGLAVSLPSESDNGAFVVKIIAEDSSEAASSPQIELYRNKDGGKYNLIASGPLFKSISQMLNRNGVYGYKVRWKNTNEFSDEAFITVASRLSQDKFSKVSHSATEKKQNFYSAKR